MEQIDTRLPSVDPMLADEIAPEFVIDANEAGPVHHAAFSAGRNALASLYSSGMAMAQAEKDIKAAGMGNDQTTADRLRRAATAKMNAASKAVADALAGLDAHTDQIQAGIDDAIGIPNTRADLTEAGRASDVRAFLRSLGKTERAETIRRAIVVEKDRAFAAAILSASPYASGISAKDVEFVRADSEQAFSGDAMRLRDSIRKMRGIVVTAGGVIEKRFGPLTGFGGSRAAAAQRSLAALENGGAQ